MLAKPLLLLSLLLAPNWVWPERVEMARIDTPAKARAAQSAWAARVGKPVQWTNTMDMKFQLIPPGEFPMGSTSGDEDAPQHPVRLTHPYYIGTHEVTRKQYEAVTGQQRSAYFPGPDMPINFVSYYEVMDFLNDLNKKEKREAKTGYRLPYEAEWEYAARAGSTADFPTGNSVKDLEKAGWFYDNSEDTTHPVGQKAPNAFGLFDMHGNVWEWCLDWYDPDTYRHSPMDDPRGPARTLYWYRVLRGGSIYYGVKACRSSNRGFYQDSRTERNIGFRIVLPVE
ncbi:MAG: formylglycine-generating enzyme family protein [Planctomycetes bacterium]|nr:formylglycine-generating enzyme family protein [Planctomycetota bacterium]